MVVGLNSRDENCGRFHDPRTTVQWRLFSERAFCVSRTTVFPQLGASFVIFHVERYLTGWINGRFLPLNWDYLTCRIVGLLCRILQEWKFP